MKINLVGFVMSVAIALGIHGNAQSSVNLKNDELHSDFVVRFTKSAMISHPVLPAGTVITSEHLPMNILVVRNENLTDYSIVSQLKNVPGVERIEFAERDRAGSPVYPTGFALLKPMADMDLQAREFCKNMNCPIDRDMESLGWFSVKIPGDLSFMAFVNEMNNSGLFTDVMRDEIIYAESHVSNDPFYSNCWHIEQLNDKDIDANDAWDIMPANSAVKNVAVIDGHGFDTTHPDMTGNWADTYNAVDQTIIVAPVGLYEKHATACAGIPGAEYNNLTGVPSLGFNLILIQAIQIGYNAQSSGSFYTSSTIQADAINRVIATPNTVAISMSFGTTSYQTAFFNALTTARTTGRNGKGIVIFASSGNNGTTSWTNYPASYSGVIAVGATTIFDSRANYSNYGTGLTLAAPGTGIMTTDIVGTGGYSTTDYYNFSGTSAACPVAASVGAMMIIANGDLTELQVKEKLAQSCEKVGGYSYNTSATETYSTWSSELGYGRVNMLTAVNLALQVAPTPTDITLTSAVADDNSVITGQTITISCNQVTSNQFGAAISPVVEYRWSTDQTWSSSDVVIGTDMSSLGTSIGLEAENITYTVPSVTGTRYILIKCDATSLVAESSESNNIVVIAMTVTATVTLPDVTATTLAVTDNTPYVGQTITISCNQTISNAILNLTDAVLEYRYSNDAVWSTGDVVIGTDTSSIGTALLLQGESINYTIPSGTGIRYILFRTDATSLIEESNETNNVYSILLSVSSAPVNPDVTISGISSTSTNVNVGQSVTVSCQQAIANPPATAIPVSLEYRWSSDLTWATTDLLLGTGSSTLGGTTITESESLTFTVPDGVGTWYLLIKADATNNITETNESNMYSLSFTVTSTSSVPDIFVDEIVVSNSNVMVGDIITVSCFQNISIASGSSVTVFMEYRWATGTTFSTSYPIIGVDYSSLGASDFDDDESLTFTIPAGTGQRYLMIRCDSNNGITESNETNNVYVIPVTVSSVTGNDVEETEASSFGEEEIGNADSINAEDSGSVTSLLSDYKVYPNPSRGLINIQLPTSYDTPGSFEIRNMEGQLIESGIISEGIQLKTIDLENITAGIYFLSVRIANENFTARIVKTN